MPNMTHYDNTSATLTKLYILKFKLSIIEGAKIM